MTLVVPGLLAWVYDVNLGWWSAIGAVLITAGLSLFIWTVCLFVQQAAERSRRGIPRGDWWSRAPFRLRVRRVRKECAALDPASSPVEPMIPEGFVYRPELITPDEERELLERFDTLDFKEIHMRGQVARRTAIHYGIDYDYNAPSRVEEAQPLPAWMEPVREKCAALAGTEPEELVEAILQRYPPGATIGWHRDAPQFGRVVGVSLGGACRLRLRRVSDHAETAEVTLEPRSGYLFRGSARWQWQHSIPPAKELRYSITFRTLRQSR